MDFSSPAHRSVTQDIPLVYTLLFTMLPKCLILVGSSHIISPVCLSQHNETHQDWKMHAEVSGEGFSGPKVLNVPAGTRACYPLTFHPSAQCSVTVCCLNTHSLTDYDIFPRLELVCIRGNSSSNTLKSPAPSAHPPGPHTWTFSSLASSGPSSQGAVGSSTNTYLRASNSSTPSGPSARLLR